MNSTVQWQAIKTNPQVQLIDLRTPKEYEQGHIPGAINLPLFTNEEHQQIGTLYKQTSVEAAKKLGVQYIATRLPELFTEITRHLPKRQVVVYCKSGGYRSQSVTGWLNGLGEKVNRLEGGYQGYRQTIIQGIENKVPMFQFVTLNGFTGVGKTAILKELQNQGAQVLDLEGLANHRGSNFGSIGLGKQPSQKMFESALYEQLETFSPGIVFVESESSKIGTVFVPNCLREAYTHSPYQVRVHSTIEDRVDRIYQDYIEHHDSHFNQEVQAALEALHRYISDEAIQHMEQQLAQGHYRQVIEALMVHYYDRRYQMRHVPYDLEIQHDNTSLVAQQLINKYCK